MFESRIFEYTWFEYTWSLKYLGDINRYINITRFLPSTSGQILSYCNNNEILALYKTTIFKRQYYNNNKTLWVYV